MTAGIRRRWNMECKKKYLPISNRHICPAQANLSQYSSGHMHTFFPIRCTWNLWKIFSLVETNRFYSSHFGESKTTTTTTKTELKIREELRHKKNPFCLASKRHKLRLMVKSVCTHIPGREKESREKKCILYADNSNGFFCCSYLLSFSLPSSSCLFYVEVCSLGPKAMPTHPQRYAKETVAK